jgi:hypothetical protein
LAQIPGASGLSGGSIAPVKPAVEVVMYRSLFAIACLAVAFLLAVARGDEAKVALGDVPKAGLEAVKAMFPAAEIQGAAKETEEGKTFFEVTLKQKGRTIDVTIGIDGKIQLVEKEISDKDLPKTVREALDAKYPKATYKIVESVESVKDGKPTLDFYEAMLITADKRALEVQVLPDGKIKNEETKKSGDKD